MSSKPAQVHQAAIAADADRAQADYFRAELTGLIATASRQIATYERVLQRYRTHTETHRIQATEHLMRRSLSDRLKLQSMVDSLDARFSPTR